MTRKNSLFVCLLTFALLGSLLLTGCQQPQPAEKTAGQTTVTEMEKKAEPSQDAEQNTQPEAVKSEETTPAPTPRLSVVATTFVVRDLADKIGADNIKLTQLMTPGADPHSWEPTAEDMKKLEEADLILANGAGMEPWLEKLVDSNPSLKEKVVLTSAGIDLIQSSHHHEDEEGDEHADCDHEDGDCDHDHDHEDGDCDHDHKDADHDHKREDHDEDHEDHHHDDCDHDSCCHHHGGVDPHTWLAPLNALKQAETICKALGEKDPDMAKDYEMRLTFLTKGLKELDQLYKEGLKPLKHRLLVTNHEAFAYLCQAYDLEQLGITGVYADEEPSAGRMAEIIDLVKEKDVKCIFTEQLLSTKVAEAISEATGAKTAQLNPFGNVSQEEIDNGVDYFSLMIANLETLKANLD